MANSKFMEQAPIAHTAENLENLELSEALELEAKAAEYFVSTEAWLAGWKEMGQFFTVKTLGNICHDDAAWQRQKNNLLDDYAEELSANGDNNGVGLHQKLAEKDRQLGILAKTMREKIERFLSKNQEQQKDHSKKDKISPHLLKSLYKLSPEFFKELILESIDLQAEKDYSGERVALQQQAKEAQAIYHLNLWLEPLIEHRQAFLGDSENIKKISLHSQLAGASERKEATFLPKIKSGLKAAEIANNPHLVLGKESLASQYGVSEDKVQGTHDFLAKRFARKHRKNAITLGTQDMYQEFGDRVKREFWPAYVNYRNELQNLFDCLHHGKIVETDYIKGLIQEALPSLRKDPPTVVFFHGDYGTGKTALSIHISREYLKKEPIIIAGNKFLEPKDFTESYHISSLSPEESFLELQRKMGIPQEEMQPFDQDLVSGLGQSLDLKNELRENLIRQQKEKQYEEDENKGEQSLQEYLRSTTLLPKALEDIDRQVDNLFNNPVHGRYVLNGLLLAMKEGRPLIIDEANAITPEVLIAFNDLLTKKIGEKISSKSQHGHIEIKPGYCVMWTGNTGVRYNKARQEIDVASYSRIHPIKMSYLPQNFEFNKAESLMSRLNLSEFFAHSGSETDLQDNVLESKNLAKQDQIFQVLLVKLLNENLGSRLLVDEADRFSVIKELYRLAMGSRIIMNLFEGIDSGFTPGSNFGKLISGTTQTDMAKILKSANLTMRELMDNIIGSFLSEHQSMDLEYYTYKFIRKYQGDPKQQFLLHSILVSVGFFEKTSGWPNLEDPSLTGGKEDENLKAYSKLMESFDPVKSVSKYSKVEQNGNYAFFVDPKAAGKTFTYLSSMEIMQFVFGVLPPRSRDDYDALNNAWRKKMFESGNPEELKKNEVILQDLNMQLLSSADVFVDILKSPTVRYDDFKMISDSLLVKLNEIRDLIGAEEFHLEEFLPKLTEFVLFLNNFILEVEQNPDNAISLENIEKLKGIKQQLEMGIAQISKN